MPVALPDATTAPVITPVPTTWAWSAGPWAAGPQIPLSAATGKTVTWRRTGNHEASFTFTVGTELADDPAGTQAILAILTNLTPLATDIWIARGGTWLPRLRLGAYSRSGTARHIDTVFTAFCYRELLRRRKMPKAINWTSASPGDAARGIVREEQARPGSNLGIAPGLAPAMPAIAFDVSAGTGVGDAVDTFCSLGTGADWDISARSSSLLAMDMWTPARGVDNGVVIDLGGAAASFTETMSPADYANGLQVTGQAPAGTSAAPVPVFVDAADIATRPEGRWDAVISTAQTTTAALASAAALALANAQKVIPAYTAKLTRGWWQGPNHLWLGDPFTWAGAVGPLQAVATYIVEAITADFSKPGEPDVTVTFGVPPRNARYRVRAVDYRLAALERR